MTRRSTHRDDRPTADEMLARTAGDSGTIGDRGRLRIYLGMAPGVGKTYRMLEEGQRRIERGTDLVVGYVETHGRPATAAMLDGLEVVPRRRVEHRGVVVEEMARRFDSSISFCQSPAIKASFLARDQPLIRRSAAMASTTRSKFSAYASFTGRRFDVYASS